jgi:hypothetical protein
MQRWLKLDNRPEHLDPQCCPNDEPCEQAHAIAPLRYKIAVADLRLNKGMIIKDGKVLWEYPTKSATDISVYSDGKVLLSGQKEVLLLDKNKAVLFREEGNRLFSAHLTGRGTVKINSNRDKAIIEKQFDGTEAGRVSTEIKGSAEKEQYHALHYRQQANGDFWVAHRHNNIVRKYDKDGAVLQTIELPCSATSVEPLPNGNVLVSGGKPGPAKVMEFDAAGKKVWELSAEDVPEANLMTPCGIQRLSNGHTLIANWTGHNFKGEYLPIIEVSPEKKIVAAITDTSTCPEPVAVKYVLGSE